ncbi:hypothetical protein IQ247_04555 [Plectonema cf. radiosum LEGE 06105]|uniref:Uncharacterized protein n=1 Tax=Plectonema cf. radiosum LEGE 06105 TaxID=945769 RepID=A0A8J7F420_9CYAN|nr:hypothetical protein [Plectonema radiosum]MBE9211989.1 hypothetical protein [Plectonema cf. radiosum LEGE 06105]
MNQKIQGRKIIFFELNEVPWHIIDYYTQKYPDSALAQKLPQCYQYETHAVDSVLSPWITWATLHRGVASTHHRIHHFNQNLTKINQEFPPIWQILSENGIKTGLFGSLHSYPLPNNLDNYTFYVPDSFATNSQCFPAKLSVFQEFNLSMARNSARNVSTKFPIQATLKLLTHLPALGLRVATLVDTANQLLTEQFKPWRKNRRRTYQAVLAFDLFLKQLKTTKPDFATFFTNHVASSMHRYWAALFPQDYKKFGYNSEWVSRYKDEIDFAMSKFEQSVTQLIRFVDSNPEYTLWIASSMGQSATTAWMVKTQLNLADAAKLMSALGIPDDAWCQTPAMFPEFGIVVKEEWVEQFRNQLGKLSIEGRLVEFAQKEDGLFAVFFGQVNLPQKRITNALFKGRLVPLENLGLENILIEDETNTNAYHIKEGSLLIYDPQDTTFKKSRKQISCLEIAPMLLQNFSVHIPQYMSKGIHINSNLDDFYKYKVTI